MIISGRSGYPDKWQSFFENDLMWYILDIDAPILSLCYDTTRRRLIDEDGFVINNPYEYISPIDFYIFLQKKEYMLIWGTYDYLIELIWPDEETEENCLTYKDGYEI